MDRAQKLQLALWREACRHIDLAESIADLAAAIHPFVPLDALWVFALNADAGCSLAASTAHQPERFTLDPADAKPLERFAAAGELTELDPSRPGRSALRALAPALGPAHVLCGPLCRDHRPEGIVAFRLVGPPDERARFLLSGALEPLAVALDTSRRFHELESLRRAAEADRQAALRRLGRESLDSAIVGEHAGLRSVMERAAVVAASDVPVLILGETGSGKEVVARVIHERSTRHDGPFLRVNCGAIPPELVDSQLFGHERGAFTGAIDQRHGWFERADGGTLFLDEIAELPLAAQVRLLRVLQDGTLERVGGESPVSVDCRIVAATHRDLAGMVRDRTFRDDLWYRLAVFPLVIPPLRERPGDLRELAQHFANRAAVRFSLPSFEITDDDVALLAAYDWPGNVRELGAVIDRAALLGQGHRLALAAAMGPAPAPQPPHASRSTPAAIGEIATLDDALRVHIESALRKTHGRIEGRAGAAALLDINPHTLRSKMRRLGVPWSDFRDGR